MLRLRTYKRGVRNQKYMKHFFGTLAFLIIVVSIWVMVLHFLANDPSVSHQMYDEVRTLPR